jgi:hypothetical protein
MQMNIEDFGSVQIIAAAAMILDIETLLYMALEVVDDIGFPYINKVNVFSFAFAVYELIFGEMEDRKL